MMISYQATSKTMLVLLHTPQCLAFFNSAYRAIRFPALQGAKQHCLGFFAFFFQGQKWILSGFGLRRPLSITENSILKTSPDKERALNRQLSREKSESIVDGITYI